MDNEFLFDIAETFFNDNNKGNRKWNFMTYWYGEFIPEIKLNHAIRWFANYPKEIEKPILLMQDYASPLLETGFLITNAHLYYRLKKSIKMPETKNIISLASIQTIDIDCCRLFGSWLLVNGEKEALISSYGFYGKGPMAREITILRQLLQIFINEIQLQSMTKGR